MEPEFKMESIFVFLGPSLSVEEAKTILPDAYYLPPVQCGDILRILRLCPDKIVIIDGYFENTAAVWHKEILFALEQGITVIGGSSMGALRACELSCFGMQGIGTIFEEYQSGSIIDDDEVAVLHHEEPDYQVTTDAMMNIRASLDEAVKLHVISSSTAEIISEVAKKQFYQVRSLMKATDTAIEQGEDANHIRSLQTHLHSGSYCNLKKKDAIHILKKAAELSAPKKTTFQTSRSAFIRALHKNIMCQPFKRDYTWLPIQERVALVSRQLDSTYHLIRRLAYLLAACHGLAVQKNIHPTEEQKENLFNNDALSLGIKAKDPVWDSKNDCTPLEKMDFIHRLAKIQILLAEEERKSDISTTPQDYLFALIRLSGEYISYKNSSQFPEHFHLLSCIAHCWWLIDRQALRLGLQVNSLAVQEYSDKFRLNQGLQTEQDTQSWLTANDLDLTTYASLMAAVTRLNFLVLQNNLDVLNIFENDEKVWWFLDALRLSGLYPLAKELL